MVVSVALSFVPVLCTTPMMMTAISAAIRPYSMAVAADLARRNRANKPDMRHSTRLKT